MDVPTDAARPLTHAERGRLGGLATKAKFGPKYFVQLGAKGFAALANKHFNGCRLRAASWLAERGIWEPSRIPNKANGQLCPCCGQTIEHRPAINRDIEELDRRIAESW